MVIVHSYVKWPEGNHQPVGCLAAEKCFFPRGKKQWINLINDGLIPFNLQMEYADKWD